MTISISPLSPGGRGSPSPEPPSGGRGLPEAAGAAGALGEVEAGSGSPGQGPGGRAEHPGVPAEGGRCRGLDRGDGETLLGRDRAGSGAVGLADGGGGPGRKFPKSPPAPALPLAAGCLGARCSQGWVPKYSLPNPWPPQEVMVNVSDLGQDLEHCQQLHRQLRKLRGVWAGVRCPASGNGDQCGLWSQRRALVSALCSRPALA